MRTINAFGDFVVVLLISWSCMTVVAGTKQKNLVGDHDATTKVNYVRDHIFSGSLDDEQPSEPPKTFLDLYHDGVSAYVAKDWPGCVHNLSLAISGYRDYYSATASCRIKCSGVARQVPPFFEDDVDDLQYYESVVRRTLCLVKCKQLLLPSLPDFFHMNQWSKEVFQTGKPYTYLQMCFYKVNLIFKIRKICKFIFLLTFLQTDRMLDAASATYTALLRDSNDRMMKSNFEFYLGRINQSVVEDLDQMVCGPIIILYTIYHSIFPL